MGVVDVGPVLPPSMPRTSHCSAIAPLPSLCRSTIPGAAVRGPTGDEPIYGWPFSRMSFLTDLTPWTLRATATALLMSA
jgi:hypothetical protein